MEVRTNTAGFWCEETVHTQSLDSRKAQLAGELEVSWSSKRTRWFISAVAQPMAQVDELERLIPAVAKTQLRPEQRGGIKRLAILHAAAVTAIVAVAKRCATSDSI